MNSSRHAQEQGVALLMTLGVLSLILILAMSFSFTARSGRQLAQNNAEVVRTRFLARSGLNRVIAALSYNFSPTDPTDSTKKEYLGRESLVFPPTSGMLFSLDTAPATTIYGNRYFWMSTSPATTTVDQAGIESALALGLGIGTDGTPLPSGFERFGFLPLINSSRVPALASWHHITAPEPWVDRDNDEVVDSSGPPYECTDRNDSGDWDECLIGRFTFVVIDESAKIDPNGVLTVNREPGWVKPTAGSQDFFDIDLDGKWDGVDVGISGSYNENLYAVPRPGLSPQEIQILNDPLEYWRDLPRTAGTGDKTAWFNWRHIGACLGGTSSSPADWTPTETDTRLRSYFPYSYDIEAYRLDTDGDGNLDDVHRLDLWSFPWDSDITTATGLQALYDSGSVANFWTGTPGGTINTLTTSLAAPALDGFTDADITLQVLANLKDFLDTVNDCTYVDVLGDGLTEDDVLGLEKTPYINEVAFEATYVYDGDNGTAADPTDDNGHISLEVSFELVNMYGVDLDISDCTANVVVEYRSTGAGTYKSVSPAPYQITASTTVQKSQPYLALHPGSAMIDITGNAPAAIDLQIKSCTITLKGGASGKMVDFAFPVKDTVLVMKTNMAGTGTDYGRASVEANDPRCNAKEEHWMGGRHPSCTTGDITMALAGSAGAVNSTLDHTGGDTEPDPDPINVSTAYIADTPRITFWELGAVHRGAPWQTINLKTYSSANPRSYVDGDAILLDQLKLGGFTEMRGRVNANCTDELVWQQVLHGVQVGCSYAERVTDTAGASVSPITPVQRDALAAALAGGSSFLHRGEFVIDALSDATLVGTQTNDRSAEEIIGKIANLLTVRQNLFTVLVTAQTVLDTGINESSTGSSVEYDTANNRFCTIQSEQKILATVYRDAFSNTFRIVQLEYLED